eukprot:TRINITY_DN27848_c0_g1_i2.p1 TRINITY_DN27848_c0_g1~~TRINITY_DN27848_c0_g1_i2.p1  ORF type:complete len:572 (-),score=94.40 TRINITY_DN27848_c0_g1_i2:443-2158(-)
MATTTLQAEVLLPADDSKGIMVQQAANTGKKETPESPFVAVAASENGETSMNMSPVASKISTTDDLQKLLLSQTNQETDQPNQGEGKQEKISEQWSLFQQEIRASQGFGIIANREISESSAGLEHTLPSDLLDDNDLPSRDSSYRNKKPSIEVPSEPQGTSTSILNSLRGPTPTPNVTPEVSPTQSKIPPTFPLESIPSSQLETLLKNQQKEKLSSLLPGIIPSPKNEEENDNDKDAQSLQNLINKCKTYGNELVMELSKHPNSSEVVNNAKKELGEVFLLLVQSLGMTDQIVHSEKVELQKQKQSNLAWQVEFWKVKYKEVAEKYNKLTLVYKSQQWQQQQQQQQQKKQQQQLKSQGSGINAHAQPWVPQTLLSRQSSVLSQNALASNPLHSAMLAVQAKNLEKEQQAKNGGMPPPDSAILSVDGVPAEQQQSPKPKVVRGDVPRPKKQTAQPALQGQIIRPNPTLQDNNNNGNYQQPSSQQNLSRSTNRGRRGKSQNRSNDARQQSTNTQDGRAQSGTTLARSNSNNGPRRRNNNNNNNNSKPPRRDESKSKFQHQDGNNNFNNSKHVG